MGPAAAIILKFIKIYQVILVDMANRFMSSPLYVGVDLESSSDEEGGSGGYRLRPRNLFNSGVSIKRIDLFGDVDSDSEAEDKDKDSDDEDVFFFLQSEEEDDELEEGMECQEKKRWVNKL